ncbi:MAG TPA: SDR family oxidoreductase [Kofleriaceae bacterium]|jgi:NAD(P)-dependent dehydrogenase (short-subunit alcohol dehydrogenase family)
MKSFAGKVVLVTGANSGIGEAAVEQLAAAGATTYGLARRPDALEAARQKHPAVTWLLADIQDPAQAKAAVAKVIDQSGRLDALVNNAAVFEFAPLAESSEKMVHDQFRTNVLGLVWITQAALPALVASKGHILNISSAAGHKAVPGGSIYGATKAAVESFTRSWALELAPQGVRVNAIAPGPTETAGFNKLPVPADVLPQIKAAFVSQTPLGRMASTDEVAMWIVNALDPNVTWMTGAILAIDGGMSLT